MSEVEEGQCSENSPELQYIDMEGSFCRRPLSGSRKRRLQQRPPSVSRSVRPEGAAREIVMELGNMQPWGLGCPIGQGLAHGRGEWCRRVAVGRSGDRASFRERLQEGPQEPVDLAREVDDSHQSLDLSAGDQRGPQEGQSCATDRLLTLDRKMPVARLRQPVDAQPNRRRRGIRMRLREIEAETHILEKDHNLLDLGQ